MDVVDWRPDLTDATVDVLARAFANNPIHVAAFGADSVVERNRVFFRVGLSLFRGHRLAVVEGSRVLGFMHWVESPGCKLSAGQRLGLVPTMLRGFGIRSTLRVGSWLSAWAANDRGGSHWHLGPIGVDPQIQRKGAGRLLMDVFCSALDEEPVLGFLETDKEENVGFYEKFGFEIEKEVEVIGAKTYFMTRLGRTAAASPASPGASPLR
jgi:ribosomal protein S18 acetylase RimI-like enzyme